MRGVGVAMVIGIAVAMLPARAAAQTEPGNYWAIEEIFREGEAPAERWWWTWVAIHAGLFLGQSTWAALTEDDGTRIDRLTGATSALLGTMMLIVLAPPAMSAPDDLAPYADAPSELREERALEILRDTVRAQRRAHSFLAHLLVVGWAIATGTFLWLGYDRPVSGALQAGSVVLIGELRILTHPTGAADRSAGWSW